MRRSRVLEKLRAGEVASCFKVNLSDPRVSDIVAMAGFDCVWLDQEHIGQDWSGLAASVWATKAHDTDTMVRIPRGSYSDYIRPLEMDASGILVPHIMSLEDAKSVVKMVRFHPLGRRPVDGGNADGAYATTDFNEYLQQANEQRFVVLQIEDPEPLDDLEAIAALDGYDMLFFGPGDFSQGIGAPGQWNHPKLIKTRKLVAEMANKYGKYAATVGSPDNLSELIDMGYNFINVGADVIGLSAYCRNLLSGFNPDLTNTGETKHKRTDRPYK